VQEAQQRALGRKLSDEVLCALINNNMRCYTESMEFAEHLEDVLADPYKVIPRVFVSCTQTYPKINHRCNGGPVSKTKRRNSESMEFAENLEAVLAEPSKMIPRFCLELGKTSERVVVDGVLRGGMLFL
jgi:hypothetical protein